MIYGIADTTFTVALGILEDDYVKPAEEKAEQAGLLRMEHTMEFKLDIQGILLRLSMEKLMDLKMLLFLKSFQQLSGWSAVSKSNFEAFLTLVLQCLQYNYYNEISNITVTDKDIILEFI